MQESPKQEQEICVQCGFCCDGTLFSHATLQPGERVNLPPKLEQHYVQYDTGDYFKQPCAYFAGCCTIYDQPRLHICSSFRCQLLRNVEAQTMLPSQAVQTVRDMVQLRANIYQLYRQIFGQGAPADFISLRDTVAEVAQALPADDPARDDINRLALKCIMLNYWLTKTFKPSRPENQPEKVIC
ncbi:hypothetical protein [Fibrella forsythiae]|uniref:YkgJ family cysteine cluster protein n=1 Tax=Fibrella forsythiae TaxID=2817061 RepID=A0ABS3JFI1_9BACT|nr:hypothetical protein [Fibrella forsythiae]MBO0948193.1 hypothetical protein [Fibrella forsythiae]